MPNSINGLSRVLGRLEADASAAKNQRELIFSQLDAIKTKLACLPQLAKTVDDHTSDISEFKKLRNKMAGVMLVLTFVGGAVGSAAVWMAKNFLSK
jgi:hypothetical protein